MIRRMRENDIPGAARLEKLYFSMPWSLKQLTESLANPSYLFLVAEEEGGIIGYGGLLRILDEGDVTNIVIEEAHRGKGLGRKLAAALVEEGHRWGIREFTLEVRVSNLSAIRIYESLGFTKEGLRRKFYEKPTEDAWIMWKRDGSGSLFL